MSCLRAKDEQREKKDSKKNEEDDDDQENHYHDLRFLYSSFPLQVLIQTQLPKRKEILESIFISSTPSLLVVVIHSLTRPLILQTLSSEQHVFPE
jgi:hypothetical protein